MQNSSSIERQTAGVLSTNKVLRQTYALLSMTLLFSAAMAAVSIFFRVPQGMAMIASFGAIGLLMFVLPKFENSTAGIGLVFLATGMLGLGLGPMLSYYLSFAGGPQISALWVVFCLWVSLLSSAQRSLTSS